MVGILNGGFGQTNTQVFCIDFLQIREELNKIIRTDKRITRGL